MDKASADVVIVAATLLSEFVGAGEERTRET
jgi:hypothetical protein